MYLLIDKYNTVLKHHNNVPTKRDDKYNTVLKHHNNVPTNR